MKAGRILTVVAMVLALAALAAAQPRILVPSKSFQVMTPLTLSNQFQTILRDNKVPSDKQSAAISKFRALPSGLQQSLIEAMDEKSAIAVGTPIMLLPRHIVSIKETYHVRPELLKPRITSFFPSEGSPGCWAYVFGFPFNDNSRVVFDGITRTTHYLGFDVEFFPNSLAFEVPGNATKAAEHDVKVIWTGSTTETPVVQYRIVAPRGYRGYWGWKFHNFSDPVIPWACFRDFFGAAAVEYAGGTHRPSAQAWYDATYKGCGGGGNCYGMSLSSLRERDDNIAGLHAAWFAANAQDYVWRYPWQTETKQTVQEYQGGQHSAEVWGLINHYYNHQTHKQAWERIRDLVLTADNRPIMGFWWAAGGGHAVVPYRTEIAGADHRIVLYDNNHQYAENETCGADPDVAIVNWNTSSFSYAGANKMICLSYDECTQPQHLPAEATGGGMGIVAAVFEQGARVSQIQDSQGRRFFNADGSINNDPATRIPDSMKYVAFMGPEIPPGYPDIFIFSNATGKSLTFNVSGTGQKLCRFFMPGDVFEVQATGQGMIILQNILTNQRGLQIPNPGALQLLSIQSTKVLTFDRGYLLNNFRNLGANKLLLLSKADGNSLDIESNGALQCNLLLSSFAAGKAVQGSFSNIEFAANSRATLQPPAWTALATGELGLQLRNLQNNQLIRDIKLPPGQ